MNLIEEEFQNKEKKKKKEQQQLYFITENIKTNLKMQANVTFRMKTKLQIFH